MPEFDPDRLSLFSGRGRSNVYGLLYKCRLERLEKLERRLEERGVDDPSKVTPEVLGGTAETTHFPACWMT